MWRLTRLLIALAFTGALVAAAPAWADGLTPDHDLVRQAVERGEIKPLADILAAVRGQVPGDVIRVEIEREKGRWQYEFRIADPNGRILKVYADGATGKIDKIEKK